MNLMILKLFLVLDLVDSYDVDQEDVGFVTPCYYTKHFIIFKLSWCAEDSQAETDHTKSLYVKALAIDPARMRSSLTNYYSSTNYLLSTFKIMYLFIY